MAHRKDLDFSLILNDDNSFGSRAYYRRPFRSRSQFLYSSEPESLLQFKHAKRKLSFPSRSGSMPPIFTHPRKDASSTKRWKKKVGKLVNDHLDKNKGASDKVLEETSALPSLVHVSTIPSLPKDGSSDYVPPEFSCFTSIDGLFSPSPPASPNPAAPEETDDQNETHGDAEPLDAKPEELTDCKDEDMSDLDVFDIPAHCHARLVEYRGIMLKRERKNPVCAYMELSPLSDICYNTEAMARLQVLSDCEMVDMQNISISSPSTQDTIRILQLASLLTSATSFGKYNEDLIREFYANVTSLEYHNKGTPFVYLRGNAYEFSPWLINKVLGLPQIKYTEGSIVHPPRGKALTNAVKIASGNCITEWDNLTPNALTHEMDILLQVCCANWLPNPYAYATQKERLILLDMAARGPRFNLGKVIFDRILEHAEICCHEKNAKYLIYPNLIFLVLMSSRQIPMRSTDVISGPPGIIPLNKRIAAPTLSAMAQLNDIFDQYHQALRRLHEWLLGGGINATGSTSGSNVEIVPPSDEDVD